MCGYNTNHSKPICAGMPAIRPITLISITPKFYEKKTRKKFFWSKTQYLQKVIFAELTFITSLTQNWSGNDFYNTYHSKICFYTYLIKNFRFRQIFRFMQKVIITPMTPKFRRLNDFSITRKLIKLSLIHI